MTAFTFISETTGSPEGGRGANAIAITAYILTLASMATVGVAVPIMVDLSQRLNASMADLGLAIGLFSLPAAAFSLVSGSIVDRLGAKPTLVLSAVLAIVADLIAFWAQNLVMVQAAMLIAGFANMGVITAVPALLMNILSGQQRIRAMSLWSTYGPAGYAIGLLICAPFAGTDYWQSAILLLAAITLVSTLAAVVVLPGTRVGLAVGSRGSPAAVWSILRNGKMIKLCLAYAVAASISYGSSLAAPAYLAKTYGIAIGASASAIAAAKLIAMLLGGIGMGVLLSRPSDRFKILAAIVALGFFAQFLLYFPGSGIIVATGAMILWLFVYGAIAATSFVVLSQLNEDPGASGIASGLIGQMASIGCFLAATFYFTIERWPVFVVVAAGGMLLVLLVFPAHAREQGPALT